MTTHTPRPWTVREYPQYTWDVLGPPRTENGNFKYEADARLIAAAPEMLEKLIELHAHLVHVDRFGDSEAAEVIAALIAKAKGEQNG